ncbi:MAG: AMP-binding protein [Proteobacteria bacterium]|nr:AMP-binding protein [Pseudomonadota bacterium]
MDGDRATFERRIDEILAALPPRVSDVILPWAERMPDHPALVEGGHVCSYGELARAIVDTRERLSEFGIRPGDRALIVGENSIALAVLFFAASAMDAWPVVVNARLSAPEIDDIRGHSGARRVFHAERASAEAVAHARGVGAETVEFGILGPIGVGALDATATAEPICADGAQQVAVLLYTSGTTGRPKGVMLTHHSLLYIAAVSAGMRHFAPRDRIYGVLPLSHIFGLASVLLGVLYHGATLYLVPRFDPAALIASLTRDAITRLPGVPAMFARLLDYAKSKRLADIPHPALRFMSAGGAPLDPALKAAVERSFGLTLNNGYGLTEAAPTISQTLIEAPRQDCSVGPLLPGVAAKLLDRDRRPVGAGEVGELWVQGPGVMKGYYRAPEETRVVIDAAGWLNTGDLARFEDDNLFIVGRSKELIIRSGFNVYPPEVEAVLAAHPAVVLSAVVGRKVPGNEEVVAFVQLAPGATTSTADLAAFAATRLAPYKRPSDIIVLDALPATSTGKILKQRLAELAAAR